MLGQLFRETERGRVCLRPEARRLVAGVRGPICPLVYDLAGMTLLVVERDERIRSEMVLDLFYQGGRVLVAGGVDEALDVMRVERLDCVLANPDLAPAIRLLAGIDRSLAALPIVAMTPPDSVTKATTIEA